MIMMSVQYLRYNGLMIVITTRKIKKMIESVAPATSINKPIMFAFVAFCSTFTDSIFMMEHLSLGCSISTVSSNTIFTVADSSLVFSESDLFISQQL